MLLASWSVQKNTFKHTFVLPEPLLVVHSFSVAVAFIRAYDHNGFLWVLSGAPAPYDIARA
ncbi:hypothetical protein MLTONO_5359 [Mesorhizobium loti]|nr:hypothetical protein MLTONO_5359 [Mesorhizobium loti]